MTKICHSRHKRPLSSKLKFKTEKTESLPESLYSIFSKGCLRSSKYTSFRSSSLKTSKRSSNEPFLPFHGSGNTIPLFLRQTLNTLRVRKASRAHSCVNQLWESLSKPNALPGAIREELPNTTLKTLTPHNTHLASSEMGTPSPSVQGES